MTSCGLCVIDLLHVLMPTWRKFWAVIPPNLWGHLKGIGFMKRVKTLAGQALTFQVVMTKIGHMLANFRHN